MKKLQRKVTFTTNKKSRLVVRRWRGTMRGNPCFIIGNGPSASDHPIAELLKDYFTIGINRAFKIIDPTILIWQDVELWLTERGDLNKLNAIKYSRNGSDPRGVAYQFKLVPGQYRIPPNPMILFGSGSTGPLAFELASCLGCSPIVLLGFDCKYRGTQTDFYGTNPHHKGSTLPNCSRGLKWISTYEKTAQVINCSDNDYFEKSYTLADIVERLEKKDVLKKHPREFYVEQLFSRKGEDY